MPIELRPSNAHRWMVCHGQPAAVQELEDRGNKYADRGTVAHGLLELALRLDLQEDDLLRYENKLLKGLPAIPVDDLMLRGIGHALDFVRGYCTLHPRATYHAEMEIPITFGKYRTQGTLDIVLDNLPHELAVVDYKNGVVYVEHEENPQLMLYALGYLQTKKTQLSADTKLRLVIVQPNAREGGGPVREHWVSPVEFLSFIKKAARAADAVHAPNPKRVAGEHCRFCRAAGVCATYAENTLRNAGLEFSDVENLTMPDPRDLTPENVSVVLRAMDALRAWLTSVEEEAIAAMLHGRSIPGYKIVGSSPRRRWDDEQEVLALVKQMRLNLDEFAPRAPLSPAQLEKTTRGKAPRLDPAKLVRFQSHITHNPVEPRVAPVDDPRADYVPGTEFGRTE